MQHSSQVLIILTCIVWNLSTLLYSITYLWGWALRPPEPPEKPFQSMLFVYGWCLACVKSIRQDLGPETVTIAVAFKRRYQNGPSCFPTQPISKGPLYLFQPCDYVHGSRIGGSALSPVVSHGWRSPAFFPVNFELWVVSRGKTALSPVVSRCLRWSLTYQYRSLC